MPRQAPVHGRVRVEGAKNHAAQRDDRERGSAAQRGYDHDWVKLRAYKLKVDPECEHCNARGRVKAAEEVDHIEPISRRPDLRLVFGNLQSLCRTCHARKTGSDKAWKKRGKAYPDWLPSPNILVTVVCGPPASGKTHYACEHARKREDIVDLDWIAQYLSGHMGHDWDREWLGAALWERNRRLSEWSKQRNGMGWLVVSAPTVGQREWWRQRMGAEIVVIEASPDQCAENARTDGRLSNRMRFLVGRWWERYQRDGRDTIVRP